MYAMFLPFHQANGYWLPDGVDLSTRIAPYCNLAIQENHYWAVWGGISGVGVWERNGVVGAVWDGGSGVGWWELCKRWGMVGAVGYGGSGVGWWEWCEMVGVV